MTGKYSVGFSIIKGDPPNLTQCKIFDYVEIDESTNVTIYRKVDLKNRFKRQDYAYIWYVGKLIMCRINIFCNGNSTDYDDNDLTDKVVSLAKGLICGIKHGVNKSLIQ